MGRSITLAELRGRALRAADMQRQSTQGYAVTDLPDLINESVAALYDLLVMAWEDYFLVSATVTVPPRSAPTVTLPTDFYKMRSVVAGPASSPTLLGPIDEAQRASAILDQSVCGYQITGQQLLLLTNGDATATLRYVPQCPYLVADSDALDLAIVPGWEAYIVCDVAAALCAKADRNTALLEARRDRVRQRIQELSLRRDAGRPHQMGSAYTPSVMATCVEPC